MRREGKISLKNHYVSKLKWGGRIKKTKQICRPERSKQILADCEFVQVSWQSKQKGV